MECTPTFTSRLLLQEYSLGEARGSLSREELEAQKRAVLRRLGLEVHDAEARQALEIGGTCCVVG